MRPGFESRRQYYFSFLHYLPHFFASRPHEGDSQHVFERVDRSSHEIFQRPDGIHTSIFARRINSTEILIFSVLSKSVHTSKKTLSEQLHEKTLCKQNYTSRSSRIFWQFHRTRLSSQNRWSWQRVQIGYLVTLRHCRLGRVNGRLQNVLA